MNNKIEAYNAWYNKGKEVGMKEALAIAKTYLSNEDALLLEEEINKELGD